MTKKSISLLEKCHLLKVQRITRSIIRILDDKEFIIVDKNNITFNGIKYKSHPNLSNIFLNRENIKIIIGYYELKNVYYIHKFSIRRENREYISIHSILYSVSSLILETFRGFPENDIQNVCGHLNDLPEDNRIENLKWMSKGDNNKMGGENSKRLKLLVRNVKLYEPYIWFDFCQKYNIKENNELPKHVKLINNIEYLLVPYLDYENLYVSVDGTSVLENNISKNIYACCLTEEFSYFIVRLGKKYIKISHLMAWAKYGYQTFDGIHKIACHLDDDGKNNSYKNIVIGDSKENGKHQTINTNINKNFYRFLFYNSTL